MNGLSLLAAVIVVIICALVSIRMRKQIVGYQNKIRHLKEENITLTRQLDSNERFDALLTEVNEAVLRINGGGGTVIAANPYARDIFGMGNSLLPQPMLQLYRDADWNALLIQAVTALPKKQKLPQIELPDRVLEPRLARLDNGEALLLCLDVTVRHKLELQRRTFLSNLMHDLKTPLTSLLGYARSMESFGDQADFRKEAAAVIADETKHVNHLLDVLLTLDQAEFGKKDKLACCDGVEVIQRSCDMLAPQYSEKQLSLTFKHDDKHIMLATSFDEVDRIITNLLVNAINHSPDEGNISVRLVRLNKHCQVSIEDEGPGIPKKHLPRVTERFYRVDKARNRQSNSHGLGLSIVKELLDANEGELKLSNREPHGLRAEFTLPLKQ
jgi:two-component system phosphate regulon sensor histidine kinase PhoR